MKTIDDLDVTPYERDQHFFKKGYEYALVHFALGAEKDNLNEELRKKMRNYMDFLDKLTK